MSQEKSPTLFERIRRWWLVLCPICGAELRCEQREMNWDLYDDFLICEKHGCVR